MHRLGSETKVTHDRNLSVEDSTDHIESLLATFELDRLGVALTDEPSRIVNRFFRSRVVAEPRHIANDQRTRFRTGDRGGVIDHLIDGHAEGVVATQHDIGDRVADED